jgi:CMP-N,N'-diacetyllegionaminic acid synthase
MKKLEKLKILSLIPARSGSKSIKNKNIIPYKGKPLIYHTIKAAIKSRYINRVLVSTDSKKYQKIAIKFGAEAPFLRPKNISRDNSHDKDLVIHALKFFLKKKYFPDLIVFLRPTTPNRNPRVIDNAIKYFYKNIKFDSMRSVCKANQPPQKMFQLKGKSLVGFFDGILKNEYHSLPRQKFSQALLPNGYVDILKPSFFFKKKNSSFFGKKILAYFTEKTLDIDVKDDLN